MDGCRDSRTQANHNIYFLKRRVYDIDWQIMILAAPPFVCVASTTTVVIVCVGFIFAYLVCRLIL